MYLLTDLVVMQTFGTLMEICSMYFAENYIIVKLKCCMMLQSTFYFSKLLIISFIQKQTLLSKLENHFQHSSYIYGTWPISL